MKKTYSELTPLFASLRGSLKDTVCDHMKELGHIKFNTLRDFPFCDIIGGEFISVEISELKYSDDGDVKARSIYGKEFSVQEEGTIDGLMDLLYYIEEKRFEIVKD